ncbi:hypothetical protein V5P93_002647 [Actinokineospora auranticolor]|uniref:Putative HAF family extracellular repeat protein n=1 Tax=Actinokineospora auranticolor TaxID=155976 RepID=A0A2S6GM52_9PSEU|nr:hypothetical protein [Actinokineospora auranticolor]PPK66322.1 putative HAF family extracellular repeat protein [Actinokineospora auranticolor]
MSQLPAPRRVFPAALLLLALAPVAAPASAADDRGPVLSAAPLPLPPGHTSADAVALNERGEIVGGSRGPGASRAVLWRGATVTDLGPGAATGINERGQVVGGEQVSGSVGAYERTPRLYFRGTSTALPLPNRAFAITGPIADDGTAPVAFPSTTQSYHMERVGYWKDGAFVGLPVPGPHLSLNAVNNNGVLAGAYVPQFGNHPYAFRCQGATCEELAWLPGATGLASVSAINDRGAIVGTIGTNAVRWDGAAVTGLPALPSATWSSVSANRQAVNERGDIVGTSGNRAVLWRDGRVVDLGSPLGGASGAVAVNDLGDVVGWSETPDYSRRQAFLWRQGRVTDLGTAGAPNSTNAMPTALNNQGVIIGRAVTPQWETVPLRWTVRPPR